MSLDLVEGLGLFVLLIVYFSLLFRDAAINRRRRKNGDRG